MITTVYGNQGAETQSTINPIPNYVSPLPQSQQPILPNMTPNFEEAMRRRAEIEAGREREAQRMRDLQMRAMQQQMNQDGERFARERTAYNNRGNQPGHQGFDPLVDAQRRAAFAQAQAMSGQAPMRGVTGFNQIGSAGGQDVMDVAAMTGAQRQAFLPGNSQGGEFGPGASSGPYDPYRDTRSRNRDFSGADWSGLGRG